MLVRPVRQEQSKSLIGFLLCFVYRYPQTSLLRKFNDGDTTLGL